MGKIKLKSKSKISCIIAGSSDISFPDNYNFENKIIICADSGFDSAIKYNIQPDIVIGDFDSSDLIKKIDINNYNNNYNKTKFIKYKPEKDDTDTMLCIKKAIELGADNIHIFGALGGIRFDHAIANIQALEYIYSHNKIGMLADKNNIITIQDKKYQKYQKNNNFYFSVFSLSEKSIVTLNGFKYSGEDIILNNNFPLGVSNEIIRDYAEIILKTGKILIVQSKN